MEKRGEGAEENEALTTVFKDGVLGRVCEKGASSGVWDMVLFSKRGAGSTRERDGNQCSALISGSISTAPCPDDIHQIHVPPCSPAGSHLFSSIDLYRSEANQLLRGSLHDDAQL